MKMMVIDDEKGICDFLSDFFERRGHEVMVVSDPLKAMDKIEKDQPQVILLDRIMPKMDGLKLLEKIKHVYGKKIKVIMITVCRLGIDLCLGDARVGLRTGALAHRE